MDPSNEDRDEEERAKISNYVDEIEERLGRLNKIAVERKNVLKDLKEKVILFSILPYMRVLLTAEYPT